MDRQSFVPEHPPVFTDRAAAEAWDAWFRWRDGARLHDIVITDTWHRVAARLAATQPDAARLQQELFDAMQRLAVLPDARVLAQAGTLHEAWPSNRLGGVVNIAAMVRDRFTPQARLDVAGIMQAARSAVRMLDAALFERAYAASEHPQLRIGLIGCADALCMLALRYDTPQAQKVVRQAAESFALGCIAESVRLAADRGGCGEATSMARRTHSPWLPPELLRDLERHGIRHAVLTALDRHPRLALLANNVADGIDPLPCAPRLFAIDAPDGTRMVHSCGSTASDLRRLAADGKVPATGPHVIASAAPEARDALLTAIEPYLDVPPDPALHADGE